MDINYSIDLLLDVYKFFAHSGQVGPPAAPVPMNKTRRQSADDVLIGAPAALRLGGALSEWAGMLIRLKG